MAGEEHVPGVYLDRACRWADELNRQLDRRSWRPDQVEALASAVEVNIILARALRF